MLGWSVTWTINSLAAMEVKGVESYQSNSKRILGKGRASLKSADGHGNDRQYNQVTQHTSGAQKLFVE